MDISILHDRDAQRFTAEVAGHSGVVEYSVEEGVMVVTRTFVAEAARGHGIAGHLVRAALDHARAQGWRVVPRCSYADAWMRRHPEYEGLRAGGGAS